VPTAAGFLYLAVVLDAFSRRIVGWPMANHLRTGLVLDALEMSVVRRRPCDVVHRHSGQGGQCTSLAFGKRCKEAGVRPSMGSVGDAYDNAMAEGFFATLECELLGRRRFRSQAEARMACFSYIERLLQPPAPALGAGVPVPRHLRAGARVSGRYEPLIPQAPKPSTEPGQTQTQLIHHGRGWCALKSWAVRVAQRRGLGRAKVALARKLAVVLHRIWTTGEDYRFEAAA
jgi:putative transposase